MAGLRGRRGDGTAAVTSASAEADSSKPQQGHWWDLWPRGMPVEAGPAELSPGSREGREDRTGGGGLGQCSLLVSTHYPGPTEEEPMRGQCSLQAWPTVLPRGASQALAYSWQRQKVPLSPKEKGKCLSPLTPHTVQRWLPRRYILIPAKSSRPLMKFGPLTQKMSKSWTPDGDL